MSNASLAAAAAAAGVLVGRAGAQPITKLGRHELEAELLRLRAELETRTKERNRAQADADRWEARVKLLEGRLGVILDIARGLW